jgi:hypothetical protein
MDHRVNPVKRIPPVSSACYFTNNNRCNISRLFCMFSQGSSSSKTLPYYLSASSSANKTSRTCYKQGIFQTKRTGQKFFTRPNRM